MSVRQHQGKATECRQQRDAYLASLRCQLPTNNESISTSTQNPAFQNGPPLEDSYLDEPAIPSSGDPSIEGQRRTVEVEDVPDVANKPYFVEEFPAEKEAGVIFGSAPTIFQGIQDEQILKGAEVLGPFADDDEWELAKWMIKNVGHNQAEAFLKLPIVSSFTSRFEA